MFRDIRMTRREAVVGAIAFVSGSIITASIPALSPEERGRILSPRSRYGVQIEVARNVSDFAQAPETIRLLQLGFVLSQLLLKMEILFQPSQ